MVTSSTEPSTPPLTTPEAINLDGFIKITTVFAAACFCIAYAYEATFLWRVGIFFGDVPIAPSDIYRAALRCIPAVAGASIFLVVRGFSSIPLLNMLDAQGKEAEISNVKNKRKWFLGLGGVLCVLFVTDGEPLLAIFGLLLLYLGWVAPNLHSNMAQKFLGRYRHVVLAIFPLMTCLVISQALMSASNRLKAPASTQLSYVADRSEPVSVLNSYEAGLLYRDRDRVRFTRWDDIKSVAYPLTPSKSPLCSLIDTLPTRSTLLMCRTSLIRLAS